MATQPKRRFWHTHGAAQRPHSWPISDVQEWLTATVLESGFVCQVTWREGHQPQLNYKDNRTAAEASEFAMSLMCDGNIDAEHLKVEITADYPNVFTEFIPGKGRPK